MNGMLVDIKKIFPVKKFNLCKTDNCLQTPLQVFNCVKTCLQLANISHSIDTVKEKNHSFQVMRLNSINNLLHNYIENKMSEIRTFQEPKITPCETPKCSATKLEVTQCATAITEPKCSTAELLGIAEESISPMTEVSEIKSATDLFFHSSGRYTKTYTIKPKDHIVDGTIILPFSEIYFMNDHICNVSFKFSGDSETLCDVKWVVADGVGAPETYNKSLIHIEKYIQTSNIFSDLCVIPIPLITNYMAFTIRPEQNVCENGDLLITVVSATFSRTIIKEFGALRSLVYNNSIKFDFINRDIQIIGATDMVSNNAIKIKHDPAKMFILESIDGCEDTFNDITLKDDCGSEPLHGKTVVMGRSSGITLSDPRLSFQSLLLFLIQMNRYHFSFVCNDIDLNLKRAKYDAFMGTHIEQTLYFGNGFDTIYNVTINLSKPMKSMYVCVKGGMWHILGRLDVEKISDTTYRLKSTDTHHLIHINDGQLIMGFDQKEYTDDLQVSVHATICLFDSDERRVLYQSTNTNYMIDVGDVLTKKNRV
jgi:hypothetical protein